MILQREGWKFKTSLGSKKRFSNQVPSKFPKARGDRVSNSKSTKGRVTNSLSKKPTSGKCGKKHMGE